MPTREVIMAKLFTVLSSSTQTDNATPAFKLCSRRVKLWGDVDASDKPAMYLMETHETRKQQPPQGMPSMLLMKASVIVYTFTGTSSEIPSIVMNNCLDSIEKALKPDDLSRNVFTLAGLVYRCWVEGSIVKTPGDLDGEGLAVVPIHILVP